MQNRILILSETGGVAQCLARLGDKSHFQLHIATSLGQARKLLLSAQPQLILAHAESDSAALMEYLSLLRASTAAQALPLLVLQNAHGQPCGGQCLALGADKIFAPHDSPEHIQAYILRLLQRYRSIYRLSSAWGMPIADISTLAEAAAPYEAGFRLHLVGDEPSLRESWAHRLGALLPCKIEMSDSSEIFTAPAPLRPPDLYVILAPHPSAKELALIARLRNIAQETNAGICLIHPQQDRVSGLVYDFGATDLLALEMSDEDLRARLHCQLRQSRRLASVEGMTQAGLREALIDPLTGLHNRRSVMRRLEQLHQNAMDSRIPLSFLLMDLDNFKSINDCYGHEGGDCLLAQIGAFLKARIGGENMLARIGGEEFLCVLPDACPDLARTIAATLCKEIAQHPFRLPDGPLVTIKMSIGIDCLLPHKSAEDSLQAALQRADRALYQAKRLGRARFHCSQTPA